MFQSKLLIIFVSIFLAIGAISIVPAQVFAENSFNIHQNNYTYFAKTAEECNKAKTTFLLTPWYKYLTFNDQCIVDTKADGASVVFLVLLAIGELLLNIAGLVAVVFVIFGGFKFITSQGEPQNIANARKTILNSLIGLGIALIAAQIVKFVASKLGG